MKYLEVKSNWNPILNDIYHPDMSYKQNKSKKHSDRKTVSRIVDFKVNKSYTKRCG